MKKNLLLIFCLFLSFLPGLPCLATLKVTVFDVGQGNCVLITSPPKTEQKEGHTLKVIEYGLLVDAGSSELAQSSFYDRFAQEGQEGNSGRYLLLPDKRLSYVVVEDLIDDRQEERAKEGPSKAVEIKKGEERHPDQNTKTSTKKTYKENFLEQIKGTLKNIQNLGIFISHPDKDHYNLLPDILEGFDEKKIQFAVFGGLQQDYKAIHDFLSRSLKKREFPIHFTEDIDFCTSLTGQGQSRPIAYASGMTHKKSKLSNALEGFFEKYGIIQILAMNANLPKTDDRRAPKKNANSIVLKVTNRPSTDYENSQSIILPGDAEGPTWDFILKESQLDKKDLKTTYLLLSHHGGFEHECSRGDILRHFSPEVGLISVGNYGRYNHPRHETLKQLESVRSLRRSEKNHYVHCYEKCDQGFLRIRKMTQRTFFSTLDYGTLTFELGGQPVSERRDPGYLTGKFFPGDLTFYQKSSQGDPIEEDSVVLVELNDLGEAIELERVPNRLEQSKNPKKIYLSRSFEEKDPKAWKKNCVELEVILDDPMREVMLAAGLEPTGINALLDWENLSQAVSVCQ